MRIVPEAKLFSKTGLQQLICSGLIYIIGIEFFKRILYADMELEFTVCSVIVLFCGLVFGLPGAMGIGTFFFTAAYINSGNFLYSFTGGVLLFLTAYTPFRLWYSVKVRKDHIVLDNSQAYMKFICIVIFLAWHYAVIALSMEKYFLDFCTPLEFFALSATSINMPLWLGMPLIVLWNKYTDKVFYRPAEIQKAWQRYTTEAMVLLFGIEVLFVINVFRHAVTAEQAVFTFTFGMLLWFYSIQRPSTYVKVSDDEYDLTTISGKMMVWLQVGAGALLLICFLGSKIYDDADDYLHAVDSVDTALSKMLVFIVLITASLYGFFGYMEKHLSVPVRALTRQMKNYLATGTLREAPEIKAICQLKQENELSVLAKSLHKMHEDLEEYVRELDKSVKKRQSFTTQMAIAASIQQGVLPDLEALRPKIKNYKIYGQMQSAKSVGGDMYNAILVDDDHLFVCIADVSGKGVPAALFMMIAQAFITENIYRSLDEGVTSVNDSLTQHNDQFLFVTMWAAVIRLSTGKCTFINAGHNPPLLKHANGQEAVWLSQYSGPVIGLIPEASYTKYEIDLQPGDSLLLYTDGLNEAENNRNEFYGNERLMASFIKAKNHDDIIEDIKLFVGEADQSDDMTYLWLKREEVME